MLYVYDMYDICILYIGVFLPSGGGVQGSPDPVPGLRGRRVGTGTGGYDVWCRVYALYIELYVLCVYFYMGMLT